MHNFLEILSHFVNHHRILAYGVLFLGIFWEGEITLIVAGIFAHLHIFSFALVFFIAIFAAVSKTLVGYEFGRFLGRRYPNSPVLKYLERRVFYFLPRFREKPFWSIVLSKFIYGVNNATLAFAGYVGADFEKYCLAELASSTVWLGAMFGLGYFFSAAAFSISHNVRNFMLLIVLFIIGFMIVLKVANIIIEIIEEWEVEKEHLPPQK